MAPGRVNGGHVTGQQPSQPIKIPQANVEPGFNPQAPEAPRAHGYPNLIPFQKGYDPRRNTGASPAHAFEAHKQNLSRVDENGEAVYSKKELEAMVEGNRTDHIKAGAARHLLGQRTMGFSDGGRPLALEDMKELMDRGLGKPHQRVMVQTQAIAPLTDVQAAARAMIEQYPALKELIEGGQGVPELPGEGGGTPNPDTDAT